MFSRSSRFTTLCVQLMIIFAAGTVQGDEIAADANNWDLPDRGAWSIRDGALHANVGAGSDTAAFIKAKPEADLLIETQLRFTAESARHNFGVILRSADNENLVLRYYDRPEAMELLAFHGTQWKRMGERSSTVKVSPNTWYSLKVAAAGPFVMAKLWPTGEQEPDWQLSEEVEITKAGRAGLVVHDEGHFQFRTVSYATDAPLIRDLQKKIEANRKAKLAALKKSLKLAVAPREFSEDDGVTRIIEVAPFANADRHPLKGVLSWTMNGRTESREVTLDDYADDALFISINEPAQPTKVDVTFQAANGISLNNSATVAPATLKPWRHYVKQSLDTLIEHGRDDYGPKKTPLFMAVLDTTTLRSPENPDRLDAIVRLEGRIHRRGEQGSNLWYDQALINAMRQMSDLTNDKTYDTEADKYITHYLENCNKAKDNRHPYHTGMPAWGTHIYWSCYEERPAGDQNGSGPHEILVFRANWKNMFDLEPKELRRIADGVWEHHIVDKATGLHNRHDDGNKGCDFAFSGQSFLHLFATMYKETGESHFLDKAKTVTNWHWNNRNKATNLPADCPGLLSRYDGNHTFTTVCGPHAIGLLEAYRITGDEYFRDIANTYIKAYDKYGWNPKEKTYWAMLTLDGRPVPQEPRGSGYDEFKPTGPVNVWRTTFYSYEFTIPAGQAAMLAYELSGDSAATRDKELLAIAKRWASVIENDMPAKTGRRFKDKLEASMPLAKDLGGAYAEDYGRTISLFVHLYRATDDKKYLDLAHELAEDAVRKLFHNGLFKGHAAKPYYETTNGVGILLYALLELDSPDKELLGAM